MCIKLRNNYFLNLNFNDGKIRIGKSTAPFYTMLMEIPDYKLKLSYRLFLDNLFTFLKQNGYGNGMIRDNWLHLFF